jgi:NADH-quinone oxidoreductase chain G
MINIELNGESYKVIKNETIIQSCSRLGEEIPRFCFHEKLSIAGNCRMCLVELGFPKSIKPVASCALPIIEHMKIFTNTSLVKKARESVLEFLLANHPLDCPICDQGGECDLQDETMLFGNDRGRFYENKRSVEDKECGPFIKTVMTRCIHCTRCVRFFSEIVGFEYFGTIGRGSSMEIGTYVENMISSEISGNVIDLCPVGALTSKPYSFIARPWELRSVESIDILDSFCSSIRFDVRGTEVLRILPLNNSKINEEWISDRTRFFYDGLKRQRLSTPLLNWKGKFICVSWEKSFEILKDFFKFYFINNFNKEYSYFQFNRNTKSNSTNIIFSVGNLIDCETIIVLKDFLNNFGNNIFLLNNNNYPNIDFTFKYIFNNYSEVSNYNSIFYKIDFCLLFDLNPRLDFPLINISLRKAFLENKLLILSLSNLSNLNFYHIHISNHIKDWYNILEGKSFFCRKFIESKNPLILANNSILNNFDIFFNFNLFGKFISKYVKLYQKDNLSVNILCTTSSFLSFLDLGLGINYKLNKDYFKKNNLFYLLGSDCFYNDLNFKNNVFIYQGHHGDDAIKRCDVILPSSVFTEKISTFFDFQGFLKKTKNIMIKPVNSKDDANILISFYIYLKQYFLINFKKDEFYFLLSFSKSLRKRLGEISPHFIILNNPFINFSSLIDYYNNLFLVNKHIFFNKIFLTYKSNPFIADPLTRASKILSLAAQRLTSQNNFC